MNLVWTVFGVLACGGASGEMEVTLEGNVRTEAGRRQAELDAWYVFGIERVENRLRLRD